MDAKRISLALATLALLSTGSAFAQTVDVNAGPVGATVDVTPTTVVAPTNVVSPAVTLVNAPVVMGKNFVHNVFNPPHAWFDLSVLGYGVTLGARKKVQVSGIPAATVVRTSEYNAVIPGSVSVGTARPVSATIEAPKPVAHIDLFGKRLFGFGSVDPRLDMR